MAEEVILALAKISSYLAGASISKFSEESSVLKELPGKIRRIQIQLSMMDNVIRQIGTSYLNDDLLNEWIRHVRNLAYHVVDVMDNYSYHTLQLEGKYFVKMLLVMKRSCFLGIADEITEIEKEVEVVSKLKDQWLNSYQLIPSDQHGGPYSKQSQDIPNLAEEDDLVGVENNRMLLTEWIHSKEPDSAVITVSGMGGLGKTTLAEIVYEREKILFECSAWLVVSQTYTVENLLRKLLLRISSNYQTLDMDMDMDIHDIKQEIKRTLIERKVLIVLDDVWDEAVRGIVNNVLNELCNGSRVIITTRVDHVAAIAPPKRRLKILPLDMTDAFELFCRKAFLRNKDWECPPELQDVAMATVEMCQGLPPAIISTGRLLSLRPKSESAWRKLHDQLQGELEKYGNVQGILNLCYHELPGHLRNCFLYCSLFPEDYLMSRESLVRLWVAEGFVEKKGRATAEEVAEGYLMELIHRNMLQFVESDELRRVSLVRMHDNLRDLAMAISKAQGFGYSTMLQMDANANVRRLSACRNWDMNATGTKFPRLRTLVALEMTITSCPDMWSCISSGSKYLAVLELKDSEISEVPESIGNLFNLRYIGLRRTKVKSIPESVEKLCNLQTLDVKQTKIEKLPRGIVKIKKLRHLLADRYADDDKQIKFRYFIGMHAPKELSNLQELQTLETVESSKDLAEQLKKLMQLRSVWIDNISSADCANIFASVSSMPFLSTLLLSAKDENEALCFKDLKPKSTQLHRLIIRGQWAKGTLDYPIFHDHGAQLKYLALNGCQLGKDPLGMLASHLKNLTYLRLNNVSSARTLALSAEAFPLLKTLVLKSMPDVNELKIMNGALPAIEGLYIVSLPGLERVPPGIETLQTLKKLWLLNLHKNFEADWIGREMNQKMRHVPQLRF
uniref:NB-ARC domain-containing protein n=2 Tax=Oryza TaxID=4527 RepID=A0A0D3HJU7_9ORYZ